MGSNCDCDEGLACIVGLMIGICLAALTISAVSVGTTTVDYEVLNNVCADYFGKQYMYDDASNINDQIECKLRDEFIVKSSTIKTSKPSVVKHDYQHDDDGVQRVEVDFNKPLIITTKEGVE